MLKTYLARQPIFDGKEELAGYELLYRHGRHVTPHSEGNQNSTEDSILDYIQFGLTRLVGNQPAYIKVKRDFIMNHEQLPPPVQPLVLVLFEDVESDDEFIAAIREGREPNGSVQQVFPAMQTLHRLEQCLLAAS